MDGFGPHGGVEAFRRDRTGQNRLVLGWTVLRFTWSDLVDRPETVVVALDAALAA